MSPEIYFADEIRYYIQHKGYQPLDKLPSERELAVIFNAQRITIRAALKFLENEHLIISYPKSGYYVAPKRIEKNVISIQSAMSSISSNTYHVSKILKFEEILPNPYLIKEMNISKENILYEIKILRYINQEPVCVDYYYLPKERFHNLHSYNLEQTQLYDLLINTYRFKPYISRQRIRVIEAESNYRHYLNLQQDDCVVLQSGCILDENEKLLLFLESYIKYDRFCYVLR